jgi:cytochrome c-type biogenesis protein CcmF
MTLAHLGLAVFVLGAAVETGWRIEASAVVGQGGGMNLGPYRLALSSVNRLPGPNYDAERGLVWVRDGQGRVACEARPERRTYDVGGETTSKVALCFKGLDDLYVVLGERRAAADGGPVWLVRAYFNPWVRLIFLGPLLMALGGGLSLSDPRLRLAVGHRRLAALAVAGAP